MPVPTVPWQHQHSPGSPRHGAFPLSPVPWPHTTSPTPGHMPLTAQASTCLGTFPQSFQAPIPKCLFHTKWLSLRSLPAAMLSWDGSKAPHTGRLCTHSHLHTQSHAATHVLSHADTDVNTNMVAARQAWEERCPFGGPGLSVLRQQQPLLPTSSAGGSQGPRTTGAAGSSRDGSKLR